MNYFLRNFVLEADETPADLPVVDGPVDAEDIETQTEEDNMDIVQAMHDSDMDEIEATKQIQDAENNGASEEEVEQLKEHWAVVLEDNKKGIWEKTKEFFKNLWAKIKAFFKNLAIAFQARVKDSKEFIAKYKTDVEKLEKDGKLKDYKYNGFKFTVKNATENAKKLKSELSNIANITSIPEKNEGENDDYSTKLRKKFHSIIVTGKEDSNYNLDNYQEDLFKLLHDGKTKSDEEELEFSSANIISEVGEVLDNQKELAQFQSSADAVFKGAMAVLDKNKWNIVGDNKSDNETKNEMGEVNRKLRPLVTSSMNVITSYISVANKTLNAQLTQCKKAFAGAFAYARKNK